MRLPTKERVHAGIRAEEVKTGSLALRVRFRQYGLFLLTT